MLTTGIGTSLKSSALQRFRLLSEVLSRARARDLMPALDAILLLTSQPPGEDLPGGIALEAEEIESRHPQRRMVGEQRGRPLRRCGERGEHNRGRDERADNR